MKTIDSCRSLILGFFFLLLSTTLFSQVAPHSVPPRWFFGIRAGMSFLPGPAPAFMAGNPIWDVNQENYTTECYPDGSVAFYCNAYRINDVANAQVSLANSGNSSTGGAVSVPDPADPNNSYYLFTANVDGSGSSYDGTTTLPTTVSQGIHYYRITRNGGTVTVSAPVQIAANNTVGEGLVTGSDMAGGYWVLAHQGGSGGGTSYRKWHVTATGVTAQPNFTGVTNSFAWQQSIKISRCQNKIGFVHWAGGYEVFNWNPTTGTLGTLICSAANFTYGNLYGCEFSPDGTKFYIAQLSSARLFQIDLTGGCALTELSTTSSGNVSEIGTMQIGPDDKIYVANASNSWGATNASYVGVINTPNAAGLACGYSNTGFLVRAAGPNNPLVFRGIVNQGWHNPNLIINESDAPTCMTFSYNYNQYYGAAIPIVAGSEQWNFGEGAGWQTGLGANPQNPYEVDGPYTIRLRVTDQACNNVYETSKALNIACPMPVSWLEFNARKSGKNALLDWSTAMEINNDYFVVEHSTDGVHFAPIGTVDGSGNSNVIKNYSFIHYTPSSGDNYYRLVQYDFDGYSSKSHVRNVNFTGVLVSVSPNPSQSSFNLTISGTDQADVTVLDVLGRVVYKTTAAGNISFGENLPKGAYVLKVIAGDETITETIVKD